MKSKTFYLASLIFILLLSISIQKSDAQPFDGCIKFDGVNDQLKRFTFPQMPHNSNFTIEFWFRNCMDTVEGYTGFFCLSNKVEVNMFSGGLNQGDITYQMCARTTSNSYACSQNHHHQADLGWHHIAMTYNYYADKFYYYYDGIKKGGYTSGTYNYSFGGRLQIGKTNGSSGYMKYFHGYMDEFRISKNIRYTSDFNPTRSPYTTDANTIALYHFNDGNYVDSVPDYSGNSNDLVAFGNPRILHMDTLFKTEGLTISLTDTFDSYKWIKCNTHRDSIIYGTLQSFTANHDGTYQVTAMDSACPHISDCIDILGTDINSFENTSQIKLYPNPSKEQLNIEFENQQNQSYTLSIYNSNGILVHKRTEFKKNYIKVNTKSYSSGLYLYVLTELRSNISFSGKFIIE